MEVEILNTPKHVQTNLIGCTRVLAPGCTKKVELFVVQTTATIESQSVVQWTASTKPYHTTQPTPMSFIRCKSCRRSRHTVPRPFTGPDNLTFFPGHDDSNRLPSVTLRVTVGSGCGFFRLPTTLTGADIERWRGMLRSPITPVSTTAGGGASSCDL